MEHLQKMSRTSYFDLFSDEVGAQVVHGASSYLEDPCRSSDHA